MKRYMDIVKRNAGQWRENIKTYQFMLKPCFMLIALYTIGISALLRANYNYRDDLRRVAWGKKGWDNYGRYISNSLSTLIHGDSYLMDVSPLSQMIAVILTAAAGVIIWHFVSEKKKFSAWDLAALAPLGLSPYYLGCISFKYDSPYMALSILASVMPILFFKYGYARYLLAVIIGNLIMCTTYQASSGIFPMLVILLCLKWWSMEKYTGGGYFQICNSIRRGIFCRVNYI